MKYKHIITINKPGKNAKSYIYDYSNTKGINIAISEKGIVITAYLSKIYSVDEMVSGNSYLFPDTIRKSLLLYLLTYSKGIVIKNVCVQNPQEIKTIAFHKDSEPLIYSMISGELKRRIPADFLTDAVSQFILSTPKSRYDKRIASLFSYINSKSKVYETERFIYLWTAFNGMYGYFSDIVNDIHPHRNGRVAEFLQIKYIQQLLGIGDETVSENDKSKFANVVMSVLKNIAAADANRIYFETDKISITISSKLIKSSGEKYNFTPYGYLLTQLAYYFRCKIVHGNKPVLLFSYADDTELHSIKLINSLLEEFIENTLPLWLDETYVKDVLRPKATAINTKTKK